MTILPKSLLAGLCLCFAFAAAAQEADEAPNLAAGEVEAPSVADKISPQDFFATLKEKGFREAALGPYRVPEGDAPLIECSRPDGAGERAAPHVLTVRSRCHALAPPEPGRANDVTFSHTYLKSVDLLPVQFAQRLAAEARPDHLRWRTLFDALHHAPWRCHENFLAIRENPSQRPVLRVAWCVRAAAKPDLYDISMTAVTQDNGREALASRLTLNGVHFEDALTFSRHFLAAIKVQR
ncbi:MAG: hypothetical protein LBI92_12265 [Azoarcus sp.]|jgi:hypothetical protein|nr:hypothetical protein [Azoarcus sp.]